MQNIVEKLYTEDAQISGDNSQGLLNGRFRVDQLLGEGQFARVYRASDHLMHREVALKILKKSVMTNVSLHRFRREAGLVSKLQHDNVIRAYSAEFLADDTPMIVMEFLNGESLEKTLDSRRLSYLECKEIFTQVCMGMAHTHKLGVIHRDLSPSNVLLLADLKVKIIDFGLAKPIQSAQGADQKKLTGTGAPVGNPSYMSPEQCRGEELDERSDIYSFGCILYEALSGKKPFLGSSAIELMEQHQERYPPSPEAGWLEQEEELKFGFIALKCMQKDKSKRFQNATELYQSLIHDSWSALEVLNKKESELSSWEITSSPKAAKTAMRSSRDLLAALSTLTLLISAAILLWCARVDLEPLSVSEEKLADSIQSPLPALSANLFNDILSYTTENTKTRNRINHKLISYYIQTEQTDKALSSFAEILNDSSSEEAGLRQIRQETVLLDKISRGKRSESREILLRCSLLTRLGKVPATNRRLLRREFDKVLQRSCEWAASISSGQSNEDSKIFSKLLDTICQVLPELGVRTSDREDVLLTDLSNYARGTGNPELCRKGVGLIRLQLANCANFTTKTELNIVIVKSLSGTAPLSAYQHCLQTLSRQNSMKPEHRLELLLYAARIAGQLHKTQESYKHLAEAERVFFAEFSGKDIRFYFGVQLYSVKSAVLAQEGRNRQSASIPASLLAILPELPELVQHDETNADKVVAQTWSTSDWAHDARTGQAFSVAAQLCLDAGNYKEANQILERRLAILKRFGTSSELSSEILSHHIQLDTVPISTRVLLTELVALANTHSHK